MRLPMRCLSAVHQPTLMVPAFTLISSTVPAPPSISRATRIARCCRPCPVAALLAAFRLVSGLPARDLGVTSERRRRWYIALTAVSVQTTTSVPSLESPRSLPSRARMVLDKDCILRPLWRQRFGVLPRFHEGHLDPPLGILAVRLPVCVFPVDFLEDHEAVAGEVVLDADIVRGAHGHEPDLDGAAVLGNVWIPEVHVDRIPSALHDFAEWKLVRHGYSFTPAGVIPRAWAWRHHGIPEQ